MALIDILYFGEVRDRLDRDVDHVDLPSHVLTVSDLIHWLRDRDSRYAEVLADGNLLCAAVDREHAVLNDSIFGAKEVALFRPVGAL